MDNRSDGCGGGIAISAKRDLNPALVRDGGDQVEAFTMDIHVRNMAISCTNAYGPQENANMSKKRLFWSFLEDEAIRRPCKILCTYDCHLGSILEYH